MTATNPVKLSKPVTSVDQDTEEVVEVEFEVEEILSTPSPTTKKGKEKAQGSGKPPNPTKWAAGKPRTSPQNVKPQGAAQEEAQPAEPIN